MTGDARAGDARAGDARDGDARDAAEGDLVVVLLACTLASLRDRLSEDGYDHAARVVADLVEITEDYLARLSA